MPRQPAICHWASAIDEPKTEADIREQRGGHDAHDLPGQSEWTWEAKIALTRRRVLGRAESADAQDAKAKLKTETSSIWTWPGEESFEWDLALGWTLQWVSIAFLIYTCVTLGHEALRREGIL